MNALVRELQTGAAALRGTTADGIIQIAEADINDAVASAQPSASALNLEVHAGNRVRARLGVVHATVRLPATSDFAQSPTLTFELGSLAVAWALKAVLKQTYVQIHGRHVTVDLHALPALQPYRTLLRHVRQIEMTTTAGVLTVRFHVAIQ